MGINAFNFGGLGLGKGVLYTKKDPEEQEEEQDVGLELADHMILIPPSRPLSFDTFLCSGGMLSIGAKVVDVGVGSGVGGGGGGGARSHDGAVMK